MSNISQPSVVAVEESGQLVLVHGDPVDKSKDDSLVDAEELILMHDTGTHATKRSHSTHSLDDDQLLGQESPGNGEPKSKLARTDNIKDQIMDPSLSVKQVLFNVNRAICCRLEGIENKLDNITKRTRLLEDKVDQMTKGATQMTTPQKGVVDGAVAKNGAVIVGLPGSGNVTPQGTPYGPNVTLITLNTEEDYPDGVWLGDESTPEMRVRVPISPSDLIHVHSNCRTAEKMALTLLDYLFDRETQSTSNLSGNGKHGKKRLDPLFIYGIRCHLIHKFNISEMDWHRIKLNVDSKCRTAFRRRVRGYPLTVKAFRGKGVVSNFMELSSSPSGHDLASQSDDSMHQDDVDLHIANQDMQVTSLPVHVQGQSGEIQILHATEEQLAHLQQTHQIQILQAGDLQNIQNMNEDIRMAVSLAQSNGGTIQVTTSTGEVIQVQETSPSHTEGGVLVQQEESSSVVTPTSTGDSLDNTHSPVGNLIINQEEAGGVTGASAADGAL